MYNVSVYFSAMFDLMVAGLLLKQPEKPLFLWINRLKCQLSLKYLLNYINRLNKLTVCLLKGRVSILEA